MKKIFLVLGSFCFLLFIAVLFIFQAALPIQSELPIFKVEGVTLPSRATIVVFGRSSDSSSRKQVEELAKAYSIETMGSVLVILPRGERKVFEPQGPIAQIQVAEIAEQDWWDSLKKYELTRIPAILITDRANHIIEKFTGIQDAPLLWEKVHRLNSAVYIPEPIAERGAGRVVTLLSSGQVDLTRLRGSPEGGYGSRTGDAPYSLIIGPDKCLHVACSFSGTVSKLSIEGQTLGRFSVGKEPIDLLVDPETRIWVSLAGEDAVARITTSGQILGKYQVGSRPAGICIHQRRIYVANSGGGTVSVLTLSGQVIQTFQVGETPWDLAVRADPGVHPGPYLYVTLAGENKIAKLALDSERGYVIDREQSSFGFGTAQGPRGLLLLSDGDIFVACDEGKVAHMIQDGQSLGTFEADSGAYEIASVLKSSEGMEILGVSPESAGTAKSALSELWVTCSQTGTVVQLSASGQLLGTFNVGKSPKGIISHGNTFLVAVERGPEVGQDVDESGWTIKPKNR
jgi:YVTN family beta-propeller protein